jgi:hypothetical protein
LKYIEDPSITRAARAEHAVMLEHLQRLYANGESYYHARTIVMAEHGPRITRECGKQTATMALNALCSYSERQMPESMQQQNMQWLLPTLSEELLRLQFERGGKWVLPPRRRWMRKMQKISLFPAFTATLYAAGYAPLAGWAVFIFSEFDWRAAWVFMQWSWALCAIAAVLPLLCMASLEMCVGTSPVNIAKKQTPEQHKASKAAAKAELDRREANREKVEMAKLQAPIDRKAKDRQDAADLRKSIKRQEEIRKYAVPRLTGPHPSDAPEKF